MFIGSIMQLLKMQSDYIIIHKYITVLYGAVLIGYIIYSGIKRGNVPDSVKLALFISLLSIVLTIIIYYVP